MTLLTEAKKIRTNIKLPKRLYTKDEEELVLAWASGEITLGQLSRVIKHKSPNMTYTYICFVLRQIVIKVE